jgi:Zn-dependent metalloprotease
MKRRFLFVQCLTALTLTTAADAQNLTSEPARLTPQERSQFAARQAQRVTLATQFLAAERTKMQLPESSTFTKGPVAMDSTGQLHVRYHQRYNGVRITGAQVIVHLDRTDRLKRVTGDPVRDLSLKTTPTLTQQQAIDIAQLDYLKGPGEVEAEAELVIYVKRDTNDRGEQSVRSAALAWKLRLEAEGASVTRYYIDAHGGGILSKSSAELTADYLPATGTGQSGWNGPSSFAFGRATDPPQFAGPYRLRDPQRGNSTVVNMELKAPSKNFKGNAYWNSDTTWGGPGHFLYESMSTWGPQGVGSGVDAAIGMQRLWDMLDNVFNQHGLDGDGKGMTARVHMRKKTGEPYGDAHWDSKYANFGNTKDNSRTDRRTVGHEFGHAMFQYALDEDDFDGEARGLNEGHGDIVGTLVNIYHADNRGVGTELPVQVPLSRFSSRMVNPLGYHDGAGLAYYVEYMGLREEHDQGCAYGHAFVFLAYGASPTIGDPRYSVMLPGGMVGIGIHKAAEIWHLALNAYMTSTATFASVRNAYIDAAEDLYGANSLEVKAVKNAFFGIKVGGGAADTADPSASLGVPVINENEQSAYVSMSASDDLGVMTLELKLDGAVVKKVTGAGPKSWYGYLSLEDLSIGKHTLRVTAKDAAGNSTDAVREFTLNGRNRLIKNGTFEDGSAQWAESTTAIYQNNSDASFLDSRFAQFGVPGQWIRQTVTIPASANAATLSYRLRTEKMPTVLPFESLRVEVLNQAGVLQAVLANYSEMTALGDEPSNGYKHFSHSLAAYKGQTIQIRFLCAMAMPTRFKVDNVSLVWSGPVDATLNVAVDAAEGSVTFRVSDVVNLPADQVKSVNLVINGQNLPGWQSPPYIVAFPTSEFTPNATYKVKAQIRNLSNTVVGTTEEEEFMIQPVTNLLDNPGFESGTFHWGRTGGTEIGFSGGEAMIYPAFLGSRYAKMDASSVVQTLKQQVYLPADADVITLGFRLCVASTQFDFNDRLEVRILDTNDQVLDVVAVIPGAANTNQPGNFKSYMAVKTSLTHLKGQMVRLEFRGINIAPKPTTFYIDNTSIVAKNFGVAIGQ